MFNEAQKQKLNEVKKQLDEGTIAFTEAMMTIGDAITQDHSIGDGEPHGLYEWAHADRKMESIVTDLLKELLAS